MSQCRQVIGYCHLENNGVTILMSGNLTDEQVELPQPAWLSMGLSELSGPVHGELRHVHQARIREVSRCSRAAHRPYTHTTLHCLAS
jgi:hypothetical protein